MRIPLSIIVATAAIALSPAASADGVLSTTGHYEWRLPPQYGPRTALRGPVRTWVRESKATTNCVCQIVNEAAKAVDGVAMPFKDTRFTEG